MEEELTYSKAVKEINKIIEEISEGELDLEELTKKIDRAKELFIFCKKNLNELRDSFSNNLFDEFDEE